MKGSIALAAMLAVVVCVKAAQASDDAAVAKAEAAEKTVHSVSVFSYVQDWNGRNAPVPVLVTMNVQGKKALGMFCTHVPKVEATVLRTLLSGTQRSRRRGTRLASLEAPLRETIGKMFPPKAMKGIKLRTAMQPSDFSDDLRKTSSACSALKG
jgi:hypothetical protein